MATKARKAKAAPSADTKIVDKLRRVRDDYECERDYHRFLLDAYTGGGGFSGRVKAPQVGVLGAAAEAYAGARLGYSSVIAGDDSESYLDRFPREDADKFQRRRDVAHYDNYCGPIADLLISYLNGTPFNVQGVQDSLSDWQKDVTGTGVTWDALKASTIYPRAALLGWCPVVFDRKQAPDNVEVISKAHENQLRLGVRAIPYFPANLLEWEINEDDGMFVWVKVRTDHTSRPDPLGGKVTTEEYRIWNRETVSLYRITHREGEKGTEDAKLVLQKPHGFGGQVPMVIYRNKPTPDDSVRGLSMIGDIAVANRRLFNVVSELDENLRCNVFPILGIPVEKMDTDVTKLVVGSGSGLKVPMQSHMPLHYVAPPESVTVTLETRITNTIREIYRMARAPFENDSGGAQSGTSRAYQFEATNRRLTDTATSFASSDQQALRLVAKGSGAANDNIEKITVAPPQDYRVDDLAVDLKNTIDAIGIPMMPATAKKVLVLRALKKLVANLPADVEKKIESELDALAKKAEADALNPPKPEGAEGVGGIDKNTPPKPGGTKDEPQKPAEAA